MGLFFKLYDSFFGKLTTAKIGELLAKNFVELFSTRVLPDLRNNFTISQNDEDLHICFSAIYIFGYIRAAQSIENQFSPITLKDISHQLASFLPIKYYEANNDGSCDVQSKCEEYFHKQIQIMDMLIKIWNEKYSIEKVLPQKFPPLYWVGKEVCHILNSDNDVFLNIFIQKNITSFSAIHLDVLKPVFAKYGNRITMD
jgi:hypothetical protein